MIGAPVTALLVPGMGLAQSIGPCSDDCSSAGLTLDGMTADHVPATGLRFGLKATRWRLEAGDHSDAILTVTLDQASGAVAARLD